MESMGLPGRRERLTAVRQSLWLGGCTRSPGGLDAVHTAIAIRAALGGTCGGDMEWPKQ